MSVVKGLKTSGYIIGMYLMIYDDLSQIEEPRYN